MLKARKASQPTSSTDGCIVAGQPCLKLSNSRNQVSKVAQTPAENIKRLQSAATYGDKENQTPYTESITSQSSKTTQNLSQSSSSRPKTNVTTRPIGTFFNKKTSPKNCINIPLPSQTSLHLSGATTIQELPRSTNSSGKKTADASHTLLVKSRNTGAQVPQRSFGGAHAVDRLAYQHKKLAAKNKSQHPTQFNKASHDMTSTIANETTINFENSLATIYQTTTTENLQIKPSKLLEQKKTTTSTENKSLLFSKSKHSFKPERQRHSVSTVNIIQLKKCPTVAHKSCNLWRSPDPKARFQKPKPHPSFVGSTTGCSERKLKFAPSDLSKFSGSFCRDGGGRTDRAVSNQLSQQEQNSLSKSELSDRKVLHSFRSSVQQPNNNQLSGGVSPREKLQALTDLHSQAHQILQRHMSSNQKALQKMIQCGRQQQPEQNQKNSEVVSGQVDVIKTRSSDDSEVKMIQTQSFNNSSSSLSDIDDGEKSSSQDNHDDTNEWQSQEPASHNAANNCHLSQMLELSCQCIEMLQAHKQEAKARQTTSNSDSQQTIVNNLIKIKALIEHSMSSSRSTNSTSTTKPLNFTLGKSQSNHHCTVPAAPLILQHQSSPGIADVPRNLPTMAKFPQSTSFSSSNNHQNSVLIAAATTATISCDQNFAGTFGHPPQQHQSQQAMQQQQVQTEIQSSTVAWEASQRDAEEVESFISDNQESSAHALVGQKRFLIGSPRCYNIFKPIRTAHGSPTSANKQRGFRSNQDDETCKTAAKPQRQTVDLTMDAQRPSKASIVPVGPKPTPKFRRPRSIRSAQRNNTSASQASYTMADQSQTTSSFFNSNNKEAVKGHKQQ